MKKHFFPEYRPCLLLLFLAMAHPATAQEPDTAAFQKQLSYIDSIAETQTNKASRLLDSLALVVHSQPKPYSEVLRRQVNLIISSQRYINAEPLLEKLLENSLLTRDSTDLAFSLARLGHLYNLKKEYTKALEYDLQALAIAEHSKSVTARVTSGVYDAITDLYLQLDDYEKAKTFALQGLDVRQNRMKNPPGLAISYNFLAEISLKQHDYTHARSYLKQAQALTDGRYLRVTYQILGELEEAAGNAPQALAAYLKSLEVFESGPTASIRPIPLVTMLKNIGKGYLLNDDPNRALQYLERALSISRREGLESRIAHELHLLLSQTYESKGNYPSALEHYKQYAVQKDSLMEEKMSKQLLTLRTRFESEEKERTILYLDAQSKQRTFERNFLLAGLAILLLLALYIFKLQQQRKKALHTLEQQHHEAEELLSEKTRLLKELEATHAHLIHTEKMASLGQLTAGIAHELNNPINFVASNALALQMDLDELTRLLQTIGQLEPGQQNAETIADLMAQRDQMNLPLLEKEIRELTDGISRGAVRSTNIISGLRTFARNSGDKPIRADLHEGLDSTLAILSNKIGEAGIHLEKHYGQLPAVTCQFDKINQVFMNIINNAIDELQGLPENKATLVIKTWSANNEVFISINDNGKGMDEQVASRIFEPFFTTKEIGKGTGLGLAISYGIVEQHGGKIEVHTAEETGTEFVIRLPLET